jgi:hypothetical protein
MVDFASVPDFGLPHYSPFFFFSHPSPTRRASSILPPIRLPAKCPWASYSPTRKTETKRLRITPALSGADFPGMQGTPSQAPVSTHARACSYQISGRCKRTKRSSTSLKDLRALEGCIPYSADSRLWSHSPCVRCKDSSKNRRCKAGSKATSEPEVSEHSRLANKSVEPKGRMALTDTKVADSARRQRAMHSRKILSSGIGKGRLSVIAAGSNVRCDLTSRSLFYVYSGSLVSGLARKEAGTATLGASSLDRLRSRYWV